MENQLLKCFLCESYHLEANIRRDFIGFKFCIECIEKYDPMGSKPKLLCCKCEVLKHPDDYLIEYVADGKDMCIECEEDELAESYCCTVCAQQKPAEEFNEERDDFICHPCRNK